MLRTAAPLVMGVFFVAACGLAFALPSREAQLRDLRTKQILVYMWGWSAEEIAPVAKRFGYQVVNAPHGNNIADKAAEVKAWQKYGFKMIARPSVPVADPFDPEDVKRGLEQLKEIVRYYDKNPDVIGFSLAWGLYGEGGWPEGFVFGDKAREAFDKTMGTPGEPLPDAPVDGQPGSLRYVRWLEFRQKTLREFRRAFVSAAKQVTHKLVGTWGEFYPTENFELNMGDAPGADFFLYDLSFGDVTIDQTRAFAETHGNMQLKTYEQYRDGILPLMAKAAGEGVIPIGFQFPMRRGHATDFLSKTSFFTDRVEDEYALRIGPDIRKLIDAAKGPVRRPDIALAYNSYSAAALPAGSSFSAYTKNAHEIEGLLHAMGADIKVIPWESLETADLSTYKLVILPNALYLNDAMNANLAKAKHVLQITDLRFAEAWDAGDDGLEQAAYASLRQTVIESGARTHVNGPLLARIRDGGPYGSYGISGNIAWNTTGKEIVMPLGSGKAVKAPKNGWAIVP